jgi:hypothetical protein
MQLDQKNCLAEAVVMPVPKIMSGGKLCTVKNNSFVPTRAGGDMQLKNWLCVAEKGDKMTEDYYYQVEKALV